MTARSNLIRDGVAARLEADKGGYTVQPVIIRKTYFPKISIPELTNTGNLVISVVGIGYGTSRPRNLRNPQEGITEVPIKVLLQKKVSVADTAAALTEHDNLVEVYEQVQRSLERDSLVSDPDTNGDFNWQRTEPLLDENGQPYDFNTYVEQEVWHGVMVFWYATQKYTDPDDCVDL